jgi:small-conductance mechanosensitive channel
LAEFVGPLLDWLNMNLDNLIYTIIAIVVVYFFYNLSIRQINRLRHEERIDQTVHFMITRIFRWGSMLIVVAFAFTQFGIHIDLVASLLVLAGGTVIGFAAMNTLGNAIAGIILMVSRPFRIGDRIFFDDRFADVEAIDLIYTKIRTTDNITISIPNQKLLQTEIEDYGKDRVVRRRHTATVGYEEPPEKVEAALLEAAGGVDGVLDDPRPYVWIMGFQNFAVEYTLFVYISDLKRILRIDSDVRRAIFDSCQRHGIDLSTPSMIRSVK